MEDAQELICRGAVSVVARAWGVGRAAHKGQIDIKEELRRVQRRLGLEDDRTRGDQQGGMRHDSGTDGNVWGLPADMEHVEWVVTQKGSTPAAWVAVGSSALFLPHEATHHFVVVKFTDVFLDEGEYRYMRMDRFDAGGGKVEDRAKVYRTENEAVKGGLIHKGIKYPLDQDEEKRATLGAVLDCFKAVHLKWPKYDETSTLQDPKENAMNCQGFAFSLACDLIERHGTQDAKDTLRPLFMTSKGAPVVPKGGHRGSLMAWWAST